jgi:hypothetical protein
MYTHTTHNTQHTTHVRERERKRERERERERERKEIVEESEGCHAGKGGRGGYLCAIKHRDSELDAFD